MNSYNTDVFFMCRLKNMIQRLRFALPGTGRLIFGLTLALALFAPSLASANTEALLRAAQTNNLVALKEQITRLGAGAINTADPRGYTLLMIATREGHGPIVEYLLRERAQINARSQMGETALMLAAFKGNLPLVQVLHKAGAELKTTGWTALHYAAYEGHVIVCRFLLEHEVEVDARAPNGSTPLMLAARQGHQEAVKLLLWERADPKLVNQDGATALSWAIKHKHVDVAKLLRDAGARN